MCCSAFLPEWAPRALHINSKMLRRADGERRCVSRVGETETGATWNGNSERSRCVLMYTYRKKFAMWRILQVHKSAYGYASVHLLAHQVAPTREHGVHLPYTEYSLMWACRTAVWTVTAVNVQNYFAVSYVCVILLCHSWLHCNIFPIWEY